MTMNNNNSKPTSPEPSSTAERSGSRRLGQRSSSKPPK